MEVLQITERVDGESSRRAGWGSAAVGILRWVNGGGRAAMRTGMVNRKREKMLGFMVASALGGVYGESRGSCGFAVLEIYMLDTCSD